MEKWIEERNERLRKPDGWFSLIGLFHLSTGSNVVGRFKDIDGVDVGLLDEEQPEDPEQHCPEPVLGTLTIKEVGVQADDAVISFTASCNGISVKDSGAIAKGSTIPVRHDKQSGEDGPTLFQHGLLTWYVKRLGRGQFAFRVKDSRAATLVQFASSDSGIPRFPLNEELSVQARFVPNEGGAVRQVQFVNAAGEKEAEDSYGFLKFTYKGAEYRLTPTGAPTGKMELLIADKTTAKETYGGGRFLWTSAPVDPADQTVALDFNQAYNPPCCFTDFCTCPRPLAENKLPFRVEAGEMTYVRQSLSPNKKKKI